MSHSEISHSRTYDAKQRDNWWEVIVYGALFGPIMLFIGASGFVHVLLLAYVETRLLQEGAYTKGVVVKRNYQGSGEFRKYSLTVEFVTPFESRQNVLKTPQPAPVCTVKTAKWPHWLPPDSAHNLLNGMQLNDQETLSSTSQSCHKTSFRRVVSADSENYKELKAGSSASIRYMQSNPSVARLARPSFHNPIRFIKSMSGVFLGLPILLGITFFCFIGALGCLRSSLVSGYRLLRLSLYGRCAHAQIIDRWINVVESAEGSVSQYCVAYRFQPSMAPPQIAAEINYQIYHTAEIGSEVIVKFLPQHPGVSRLLKQ